MQVVRTRAELRAALAEARRPVGLIPTMGALHDGHASLIRRARSEAATVVVSLFVNPRQFAERHDLASYPRHEAHDLARCEAEGVDVALLPSVDEIYPPGFDTTVHVEALTRPLEGAARPGHFDGVATVVAILLGLVGPELAYFGRKDAQQLAVVQRMVRDLGLPTTIVACPTVREPDGVALSSRNVRLSPAERAAAPVLFRALTAAAALRARGERDAEALRVEMRRLLAAARLATVDYVSAADPTTLEELALVDGPVLLSLAVRFGSTRLIDNVRLDADGAIAP